MRDVLLSATAGFLTSCAAAFTVHRTLWRSADLHARELDDMVGNPTTSPSAPGRRHTESFEAFIVRRAAQWWNAGVDNVHARLGRLPATVGNIVDDVKSSNDDKS